eukprot:7383442-Prymnesium_polylepis.4
MTDISAISLLELSTERAASIISWRSRTSLSSPELSAGARLLSRRASRIACACASALLDRAGAALLGIADTARMISIRILIKPSESVCGAPGGLMASTDPAAPAPASPAPALRRPSQTR